MAQSDKQNGSHEVAEIEVKANYTPGTIST